MHPNQGTPTLMACGCASYTVAAQGLISCIALPTKLLCLGFLRNAGHVSLHDPMAMFATHTSAKCPLHLTEQYEYSRAQWYSHSDTAKIFDPCENSQGSMQFWVSDDTLFPRCHLFFPDFCWRFMQSPGGQMHAKKDRSPLIHFLVVQNASRWSFSYSRAAPAKCSLLYCDGQAFCAWSPLQACSARGWQVDEQPRSAF